MDTNLTTIQYGEINGIPLEATFIKAEKNRKDTLIFYIHGGGLVYGHRMDLPDVYINLFLENGYDFFTIDYPLAPETKLDEIASCTSQAVDWFLKNAPSVFGIQSTDYVLFGRSSGAYLCLLLNKGYLGKRPKAIISFYGYPSLMNGLLKSPNHYYMKFPKLQYQMILKLIADHPIVYGNIEKRFTLYVYYRQTGKWVYSLINEKDSLADFSLTEEELKQLPPTFLTASTADQDVPYQITENMSKVIPVNELFTVHNLEHDYDRATNLPESQELYGRVIKFLNKHL